jgi:protein-disulfide isomerase
VTFVEFADFQSDDCGRAAPMARNLHRMYPERARFEFRQFPSSQHPDAYLAAEASLAANAQGKFWEFHDVLFANPHDLSREALERYAASVGMDVKAFRHALDTRQFADDVNADVALGRHMRVREVPSVFVNGEPADVPYGDAELTQLVQAALGSGGSH